MKTTTAEELVRRAGESFSPEIAAGLKLSFSRLRELTLEEREAGAAVSLDRLRLTSTTVKFQVDPDTQQFK